MKIIDKLVENWKPVSAVVLAVTIVAVLIPTIPVYAPAPGSAKYPLSPGVDGNGNEKGFCILNFDAAGRLHWLIVLQKSIPNQNGHFDINHRASSSPPPEPVETDVPFLTNAAGNANSGDQVFPLNATPSPGDIVQCHAHPNVPNAPGAANFKHLPRLIAGSGDVTVPTP